eukprot:1654861-Pleurochrysis_carterae.AAC.1
MVRAKDKALHLVHHAPHPPPRPSRSFSVSPLCRTRCLDATTLELRLGGRWHRCPTAGGDVAVASA